MKKLWFIPLALVILLLIPFSVRTYEDGGTRVYSAAAYKIITWHRLTGYNVYEHTDFYPFPLNLRSIDAIWDSKMTPHGSGEDTVDFTYRCVNVYPQDYDTFAGENNPAIVCSRKELLALNAGNDIVSAAPGIYTEAFFCENTLIAIPVTGPSSDIRYRVTSVRYSADQGCYAVTIDRLIPESADCVVEHAYILITVPRQHPEASCVSAYYQDSRSTPVNYHEGDVHISISLPDGWQADRISSDAAYGDILQIFRRDGGADRYMQLYCTRAFGVCGTGLTETAVTLGENPARIGSYSDGEGWDFVVFTDTPGEYVAINYGLTAADSKTALDILRTATFH